MMRFPARPAASRVPPSWRHAVLALGLMVLALAGCSREPAQTADPASAAPDAGVKPSYQVAWSIYAGWMPWGYAQEAGIVDRWADKYGIDLELVQMNDYIESVNQYTAGRFAGVSVTNMDALTIPAAGGVDTTVLIVGDYSNGNDGLVLKGKDGLAQIKGQRVHLAELSVSHYLLARALESVGLGERDVSIVNTSDADIVGAWQAADTTALAAWNPQLAEILATPQAHGVFDSSQIPGEILDTLVINTQTLEARPELGKALVGIWYETLALLQAQTPEGEAARRAMATAAGTTLEGYEAQLATTYLFYTPDQALAFVRDPALRESTDRVRSFSFEHGLFGANATSKDFVGIGFPDGGTLGDPDNVKLRFDDRYVALAADGQL
ncbi:putative urea ABC transporter substrate-binding protein [Pseudoxanthomonas suwonensis]|nr:putative urea ABC transporter substrate-binding protein [Pseudoxanthomonas suwonensis]